ncbi:type VI secretion system Vgr family protein [Yersinia enterocolitica]|uniref:type VI secretion system Vgr family protein n=1 Tax=Yersinia enterocolitica TaxID=630 RepID=UPI003AB2298C
MHFFENHYKDQQRHFLKLHGKLAEKLLPISITGYEGFSKPYCYNLNAFMLKNRGIPESIYGSEICCEINNTAQSFPSRFVHGIITHIECRETDGELIVCNIKLQPKVSILGLGKRTRVWKEKSIPDIISSILKEYNINGVDFRLYNGYPTLEYCIQYRESDYNFMSRIISEVGIYYYFVHTLNKHTMVLADHQSAHSDSPKSELYFDTHNTSFKPASINEWHVSTELIPGEFSLTGYDINKADGIKVKLGGYEDTKALKKIHFGDISPFNDKEQLKEKIDTVIRSRESNTTFWWGSTDAWWLSCGERFQLKSIENNVHSYYVFSLKLSAFNDYGTRSGDFNCQIQALKNDIHWCPLESQEKPIIPGVLIAKVIGPESEEVHTDAFGRVKIQFPWEEEDSKNDSSCWVRVSQHWSGSGIGSHFIPRVGSEVFVSFIQGDPNHPVIIGSVYNGKNKPPFELPKNKSMSGFVTKSISNGSRDEGHRLIFDDKKGDECITVASQKDFLLTVKNDAIKEVQNKLSVNISKGRYTKIENGDDNLDINNGNLNQKIVGNLNVELTSGNYKMAISGGCGNIKSDRALTIESTQSLILKVGSNKIEVSPTGITITGTLLKIEGKATTEVKGAMMTVQGSAITQIKGGIINIG